METLLVALAAIVAGVVVGAFGTRRFYLLMPLWGFVTGLVLGADLAASIVGDELFATPGGWLSGVALGLLLAALVRVWFFGAVLVLGVGLGASVASGLLAALGLDPGRATLAAGVVAGALMGLVVIAAHAPSRLVAAITAYTGATWATAGVMLLIGRVDLADLHGVGMAGAMRGDVPALTIAFVVGTLAFGFQALDLRAHDVEALQGDAYRF